MNSTIVLLHCSGDIPNKLFYTGYAKPPSLVKAALL